MMLTEHEKGIIDLLGRIATFTANHIIGHGQTRDQDIAEMEAAIHILQRMILAQAAARQHPRQYRLLGETIPK